MRTVVIDLSYLRGHKAQDIACELQGYRVLVTCELVYEIMTNSAGLNPGMLLGKLRGMDVVQSRCLVGLVNQEIRTGESTVDVVDHDASQRLAEFVREGSCNRATWDVSREAIDFYQRNEPLRLKAGLDRMWDHRFDDIFTKVQKSRDPDPTVQVRSYLALMQKLGHSSVGSRIATEHGMSRSPEPGWLAYEWERLRNYLAFRYRVNASHSCQLKNDRLANNLLDLHYVALLIHADALATHDTHLHKPLAQAFGSANLAIIGC